MRNFELVLTTGWPKAVVKPRGSRLCAYLDGKLVGEVALYRQAKFAFLHYGFGGHGGVGNIARAVELFEQAAQSLGWTYAVKGGNPLLSGRPEPKSLRDFAVPTQKDLTMLREQVLSYLAKRFPDAKVAEIAIYAGMGWVLASQGKDALGIRDIDLNVFFAAGGPRSLAWITKLPTMLNKTQRTIDLYWNTLAAGETWQDYLARKSVGAKQGRWLTIPDRPWVSLLTGKVIWKGRMD